MSSGDPSVSWTDPQYVATVVGVLATAALYFYSGLTGSGPTVGEITVVLLAVLLPVTVPHEVARRWL